jgi:hypothetical protein
VLLPEAFQAFTSKERPAEACPRTWFGLAFLTLEYLFYFVNTRKMSFMSRLPAENFARRAAAPIVRLGAVSIVSAGYRTQRAQADVCSERTAGYERLGAFARTRDRRAMRQRAWSPVSPSWTVCPLYLEFSNFAPDRICVSKIVRMDYSFSRTAASSFGEMTRRFLAEKKSLLRHRSRVLMNRFEVNQQEVGHRDQIN